MKLGQALSIFEAALPAGDRRPLSRHADQAPGRRAAAAGRDRPQGAQRAARRRLARQLPVLRRPADRRRLYRPGAQGRLARRPRRSRSRSSTREPARRCSPTSPSWPGWASSSACCCPGSTSRRCWPSCASGSPRSSTICARPRPSTPSPWSSRTTPTSTFPTSSPPTSWCWSPSGWTAPRCPAIITDGTKEERDRAGLLFVRFLFCSPARVGMLHADPHPGNFRIVDNGKLGVLDFGAVNRMPDGYPQVFGQLTRIFNQGDMETVVNGPARRGLHPPRHRDGRRRPARVPRPLRRADSGRRVHFQPRMASSTRRPASPISAPPMSCASSTCRPPTSSSTACTRPGVGVLCQLGATARFRDEAIRWVPGFADEDSGEPTTAVS